jgi:hypothetical protein
MSDKPTPTSPWQLNRTRIIIVLMVVLALATILGSTIGGSLSSYEALKEGADAQTPGVN